MLSLYVYMEWTGVTSAFTEHLLSLESIRYFIIIIIIIIYISSYPTFFFLLTILLNQWRTLALRLQV